MSSAQTQPDFVAPVVPRPGRNPFKESSKWTKFFTVSVESNSECVTSDEELANRIRSFRHVGTITNAVVIRYDKEKSSCFGFVEFVNSLDAALAVDASKNGTQIGSEKGWRVARARARPRTESEREAQRKAQFEHGRELERIRARDREAQVRANPVTKLELARLAAPILPLPFPHSAPLSNHQQMLAGIRPGGGTMAYSTRPFSVARAGNEEERRAAAFHGYGLPATLEVPFTRRSPPFGRAPAEASAFVPMCYAGTQGIRQRSFSYGQQPPGLAVIRTPRPAAFPNQQQTLAAIGPGTQGIGRESTSYGQRPARNALTRRPRPAAFSNEKQMLDGIRKKQT